MPANCCSPVALPCLPPPLPPSASTIYGLTYLTKWNQFEMMNTFTICLQSKHKNDVSLQARISVYLHQFMMIFMVTEVESLFLPHQHLILKFQSNIPLIKIVLMMQHHPSVCTYIKSNYSILYQKVRERTHAIFPIPSSSNIHSNRLSGGFALYIDTVRRGPEYELKAVDTQDGETQLHNRTTRDSGSEKSDPSREIDQDGSSQQSISADQREDVSPTDPQDDVHQQHHTGNGHQSMLQLKSVQCILRRRCIIVMLYIFYVLQVRMVVDKL